MWNFEVLTLQKEILNLKITGRISINKLGSSADHNFGMEKFRIIAIKMNIFISIGHKSCWLQKLVLYLYTGVIAVV